MKALAQRRKFALKNRHFLFFGSFFAYFLGEAETNTCLIFPISGQRPKNPFLAGGQGHNMKGLVVSLIFFFWSQPSSIGFPHLSGLNSAKAKRCVFWGGAKENTGQPSQGRTHPPQGQPGRNGDFSVGFNRKRPGLAQGPKCLYLLVFFLHIF